MMHTVDDHESNPFKVEEDQQPSAPNNDGGCYFSPLCHEKEREKMKKKAEMMHTNAALPVSPKIRRARRSVEEVYE